MENKTKYILLGLGVVAVGTGAFIYTQNQKKKRMTSGFESNLLPDFSQIQETTGSSALPVSTIQNGFPLRKGSRGKLVVNLQNALLNKYGAAILPKYGADGHFGQETIDALNAKGLPTSISSDEFTRILMNSPQSESSPLPSSSTIADTLHQAILSGDLNKAILALGRIKSINDYSIANIEFKKKRVGLVRKTIVTGLLDRFNRIDQKKRLNDEFYRIGLKYDGSRWSLEGTFYGIIDRLVTTESTKIWNDEGKTILVPKATILGEYLDANNGATEFETMDGKRLFVKTSSISYL